MRLYFYMKIIELTIKYLLQISDINDVKHLLTSL